MKNKAPDSSFAVIRKKKFLKHKDTWLFLKHSIYAILQTKSAKSVSLFSSFGFRG